MRDNRANGYRSKHARVCVRTIAAILGPLDNLRREGKKKQRHDCASVSAYKREIR